MANVNWWLMVLAFLLGLVLTLLLIIRRVKREVPEYAAFAAESRFGAAGAAGLAGGRTATVEADDAAATVRVPKVDTDAPTAKFAEEVPGPHGLGSARPAADGSGPVGWTVKGNEDSMLYHSPESPAYDVTVAEVWFRDESTAEAAGFNRWDSGLSQRGKK